MHLKTPGSSTKRTLTWIAVLLPICLTVGLSCEDGRMRSHSQSGSVRRVPGVPKASTIDAGVAANAGSAGISAAAGMGPMAGGGGIANIGGAAGGGGVGASAAGAAGTSNTVLDAGIGNAGSGATPLGDAATPNDASTDAATSTAHVERAILVSIDGLGGKYLELQFDKGKLPAFTALRQAGSSTLNARSDYDNNYTLPNHTTILTGRPVNRDMDLPPTVHHGWTINGIVDSSYTLHNAGNPTLKYVASVFDVAHDRGRKTCLYAGKAKFSLFSNSYNGLNGAEDTVGVDNGRNKIDRVLLLEDSTEMLMSTIESDLRGGVCDLAFIHITDLDTVGHATGWGSDAWYAKLDIVDGWVQRLAKFTSTAAAGSPFGLVVTADHGGGTYGHGDPEDIWDYQIPFFAVAPGYTPNSDLYAMTGGKRVDPGLVRPRYSAIPQPIRNADGCNVVLAMLGLPPVPGSLMGSMLPSK